MTGETTRRGYGSEHQALRRQYAPAVERGEFNCARCHQWIEPGTPWDLGHHDADRSVYTGPEHTRCNRATQQHGRATARRPVPPGRAWIFNETP